MSDKLLLVEISLPVLRDILKLPKDINLLRVRQTWEDEKARIFELLVECDRFQEVPEAQSIPRGEIRFSMIGDTIVEGDIISG